MTERASIEPGVGALGELEQVDFGVLAAGEGNLHGFALTHVQAGVKLSSPNDRHGVASLLVGGADHLDSVAELDGIEVVGEEVDVFGGSVNQAVRHQRVSTSQSEPVIACDALVLSGRTPGAVGPS